jgi:hypothetical protein
MIKDLHRLIECVWTGNIWLGLVVLVKKELSLRHVGQSANHATEKLITRAETLGRNIYSNYGAMGLYISDIFLPSAQRYCDTVA